MMKNTTKELTEKQKERLRQFNDYWGKKVVKSFLIDNGVDENTIYDTKKYDCCDLIVEMSGTIHIIEIKNRWTPPKYYRQLESYAIQDVKYDKLIQRAKDIEVAHNKRCKIWYINMSQHNMLVHDITDIDISKLEIQPRWTNKQHNSEDKELHNYYQLQVDAPYTKTHPINNGLKEERGLFYGSF